MVARPKRSTAYLVTTAAQSPQEELAARERRYLWTMGLRVLFFIVAVLLYELLPTARAIRLVAAGLAMVLPWIAVVAANAGPVRKPGLRRAYRAPPQPAVGAPNDTETAPSPTDGPYAPR